MHFIPWRIVIAATCLVPQRNHRNGHSAEGKFLQRQIFARTAGKKADIRDGARRRQGITEENGPDERRANGIRARNRDLFEILKTSCENGGQIVPDRNRSGI
jgi:hypothetical protein